MDERKSITCYHEAGHIITSAIIGKRVKWCSIYSQEEGGCDYFPDDTLPPNTVPGVLRPDKPLSLLLSLEECEAERLKIYRSQNLVDVLMTLAAGNEATLIYAEGKNWNTEQIIEEAKDQTTRDLQDMNAYIDAHGRQFEREKLINNARLDARRVLSDIQIWGYVCDFAELLIARGHLEWLSPNPYVALPENYKLIINQLITTGRSSRAKRR